MKVLPVAIGAVVAVGLLAGAVAFDRSRTDAEDVEVVFGEEDGLPDELEEGVEYTASFVIGWSGPVSMRDGLVSVFQSRRGATSEDAPEDRWPLACNSEFDDVVSRVRMVCPFVAPGPGEFALLLEVRTDSDKIIGETLYVHLVVPPGEASSAA